MTIRINKLYLAAVLTCLIAVLLGSSVYTRITPFQGEFSGGLIIKQRPS